MDYREITDEDVGNPFAIPDLWKSSLLGREEDPGALFSSLDIYGKFRL
jgi:hypothetical protein